MIFKQDNEKFILTIFLLKSLINNFNTTLEDKIKYFKVLYTK